MTELGKNVGLSGQCFPVRSLTRNNALGSGNTGGAWLVAYKAEQRRRFKAVLCREPDVALSDQQQSSKQSSKLKKVNGSETRRKLDGIYLMNACYINDPLDLCNINIAGKKFTLVNEDDFSMFKNVIHIDAGDNNLQLLNFRRFPSLKTLELPLNNISGTIALQEKDFVWLETLDLSCNHLTTEDVSALGVLPVLKILHLTGNQLEELPTEMCRSFLLKKGEKQSRFRSLEKLWLDQNNLTDFNTFTCLAGLKKLKYLNLEQNNITSVPHLRLLEPNLPGENYSHTILPNFNEMIDEELQNVNSKISLLEEILYNDGKPEGLSRINSVIENDCSQGHLQGRHILPFPSLRHLNLADNQIEEEEGLLTLSTWPCLEEVVVWGNPVAISGKEGPPIVMYQLGLVSGIKVARNKPLKKAKDTSCLSLVTPPRKIADVPTINQTRNMLMLEAPKHELGYTIKPLPPIPSSAAGCERRASSAPVKTQHKKDDLGSSDIDGFTKTEEKSSRAVDSSFETPRQNISSPEERVFLTQAEEVENEDVLFFSNEQQKLDVNQSEVKGGTIPKSKPKIPKKYKGYEDIVNVDEQYPEDIELPKTIHGNVTALKYALAHPLTFTEQCTAGYHRKQPSKRTGLSSYETARPTVEELGSILDKMRTHSKTVESNLDNVLKGPKRPKNKKEYEEAKRLLNEVQTKYNEVRCESLRSTAMAADILQQPVVTEASAARSARKASRAERNGISSDNEVNCQSFHRVNTEI